MSNKAFPHQYLSPAIAALLGILLSILAFLFVVSFEKTQDKNKFEKTAFNHILTLEKQISTDLESLHSIVSFYNSSTSVDRFQFRKFVTPILARTDTFQALEWIPRVPADQREKYEQGARNDGYSDFQIKEYSPGGTIIPAASRDEYFPVYYLEPYIGNEKAFGFHLNSNKTRAASLNRARDTGEVTFSERVTLIQETEQHYGVLAFAPVYNQNQPIQTVEQRRDNLLGFVLGVIRIKNVFDALYSNGDQHPKQGQEQAVDIYLYDENATESKSLLYVSSPSTHAKLSTSPLAANEVSKGLHTMHEFSVGGRTWLAITKPASTNFDQAIGWPAWMTLLIMLMFSALLTAYIRLSSKKKAYVDTLVDKRTRLLRESESQLQAIVDNLLDGLITIDIHGTIESFNPAAEKIFGYASKDVIGKNVNMLMPEPYHEEHDGYLRNYLASRNKKIIGIGREVRGLRKDGSTFPLDLAVNELDLGYRRLFIGTTRDITEREQAENAIHDNAERIRAILDTVADGIITFNEQGIIESFNPAGAHLFGYTVEELKGIHFSVLMTEDAGSKYTYLINKYMSTRENNLLGVTIETEGQRSDDSIIPIEFAVNEMRLGGERHFTAVVRDITERKKIDRMKNEFISTVSHELRTPLTSIRGALGLVLGKSAKDFPPKVKHLLETANRNSERLTYLINDILDLEKMQSGRLDFEFNSIDILELSQHALEENNVYAKAHNIKLELVNELTQPTRVRVDEIRMLQVYANLISNAVKFSPREGVVTIHLSCINGQLHVGIKDQGEGIPKEFRSRIFSRFAQADSSDSREKGGTGLGLTITKAIVEQHKGIIDFKSEPGQGSEFYFEIPVWEEMIESTTHGAHTPLVLVCEDDHDAAVVLASLLEQEGLTADIAATAHSARLLLEKHDYQLMLLDLALPDADGLHLISELRDNEKTLELPIIVVSGRANEGRKEINGDAVTVIDWLQKPIDTERLSKALQQALHGDQVLNVLHVEDNLDIVHIVQTMMEDMGNLEYATTLKEAHKKIVARDYDLIILDISLPDGSGLDLLDAIKDDCPVVIFSATEAPDDISAKVAASLTKSRTQINELISTVKRVLHQH